MIYRNASTIQVVRSAFNTVLSRARGQRTKDARVRARRERDRRLRRETSERAGHGVAMGGAADVERTGGGEKSTANTIRAGGERKSGNVNPPLI